MSRLADSLAGAALRLAGAGWFVLALQREGKAPAITRGVKSATRDPRQLERWWQRGELNVGIAAGAASGLSVVDVDSSDAARELASKGAAHGGLPDTVIARTPRGYHLYFKHVPELRNRVRAAGLDLDVRNDGGYVVAPPSRLSVTERYTWITSPWTTPVAEMPDWLCALLRGASPTPLRVAIPECLSCIAAPYGAAALRREADQLSRAAVGTRNHELNRTAFRMGSLIEACGLSELEIMQRLVAACAANGLLKSDGARAVERTIASGSQAGRAKPRRAPERGR